MNKRIEIALGLLISTLLPVVATGTCLSTIQATTSAEDFILDDINGTATHAKTGLTWMRCSLGQTWESAARTCSSSPLAYTWGEALHLAQGYAFAGYNDWRMPNVKELQTIVEMQCSFPSINETVFPQTRSSLYWSSSSEANNPGDAWGVSFISGHVVAYSKANGYPVRLVRGGSSFGDYSGDAVYQTFTISTTGTGAGAIASTPAGIDCGALCSAPFPVGASVTLTATPASGSTFTGWSGACTGTGTCAVTMDQDRSVTATFSAAFTVTALADPNGTISPATRSVNPGATTTFTVTPNTGYSARVAGCGGTLAGTTYTTGAINAACTVVAEFTPLPTATIPTPTLDALPSALVNVPYGAVVTAAGGRFPYTFSATGLPAGLTLTATGALTGTPTASGDFTPTIIVTDAQGQTGARVYPLTVAAATALTLVNPALLDGVVNAPYQQTLTALGGRFPYTFSATGLPAGLTLSADGLLTGTPAQAGDTAVEITVQDPAGHTATASTVFTVRPAAFTRPDAGQTGETLSVALTTPSGATCTLDDQNTRTFNVGDLGAPATNPPGVTLTDGLLQLIVKGCTAGGVTLNVTLAYPNALPPGAQYWKYGPTFDDATNHWYVLPGAHLAGNIATFTLIDGGLGDADLIANAQITDPSGPAIPFNTIDGAVPTILPIGEPYRVDFQARCNAGVCPADSVYHWSLAAGALPDGLTLTGAGATATLSGTPTRVGRYPFTVQVLARGDQPTTTQQRYTVAIIDPAATRLITHYYVSILEREPEAEGLAYWQGLIAELQERGQDAKPVFRNMANFFFNSEEYLGRNTTDRQFITNLYLTFFQREPDAEGYAFWLEQLANGMIRNTAMAGFLYSPEFTTFMEEVGF